MCLCKVTCSLCPISVDSLINKAASYIISEAFIQTHKNKRLIDSTFRQVHFITFYSTKDVGGESELMWKFMRYFIVLGHLFTISNVENMTWFTFQRELIQATPCEHVSSGICRSEGPGQELLSANRIIYPFDGSSVISNTFYTTFTARLMQAIFQFRYHLIR